MKVSKQDLNKLLKGMEELLAPAYQKKHSSKMGHTLIGEGVFKDAKGKDINPKLMYKTIEQGQPINHNRAMKQIIKDAKDEKIMQENLAAYLLKYGIPQPQKANN